MNRYAAIALGAALVCPMQIRMVCTTSTKQTITTLWQCVQSKDPYFHVTTTIPPDSDCMIVGQVNQTPPQKAK